MTPYGKTLAGAEPKSVVEGIVSLLREGHGSPQALDWTAVCVRSGECTPACPEKVDAKMMLRIARITASGGLGGGAQLPVRQDRDFFDRVRAFARLQLSDDELKHWT
jgi:hypothetical protein